MMKVGAVWELNHLGWYETIDIETNPLVITRKKTLEAYEFILRSTHSVKTKTNNHTFLDYSKDLLGTLEEFRFAEELPL
jgi:hypothetical protein